MRTIGEVRGVGLVAAGCRGTGPRQDDRAGLFEAHAVAPDSAGASRPMVDRGGLSSDLPAGSSPPLIIGKDGRPKTCLHGSAGRWTRRWPGSGGSAWRHERGGRPNETNETGRNGMNVRIAGA